MKDYKLKQRNLRASPTLGLLPKFPIQNKKRVEKKNTFLKIYLEEAAYKNVYSTNRLSIDLDRCLLCNWKAWTWTRGIGEWNSPMA